MRYALSQVAINGFTRTLGLLVVTACLHAGELTTERDAETGWTVHVLAQDNTVARFVPQAGANVVSIQHHGVEYLHQPESLAKLPGVNSGTPLLYPTPNRIKGGQFRFEDKDYVFKKGSGNHIHGLVNRAVFQFESSEINHDSVSVTASISFNGDSDYGRLFPWVHAFRLKVTVSDGRVRWNYEVDNKSERNLPFGVALHPYIRYHGSRKDTFLTVPANSLMESIRQLPTGNLLNLSGHPLDARQPVSLDGFQSDDVFFGMQTDKPAKIEFRNVNRSITFRASAEFTHLVVWTPNSPYLGIENQTCSTDAHNLAAQGKNDVAHLQICPPAKKRTGWVEFQLK